MKVTVFGCGLMGLVTAAALAETGNDVVAVPFDDQDVSKLRLAQLPVQEPGLTELVSKQVATSRLSFTKDWKAGVMASEVIILSFPSSHLDYADRLIDCIADYADKEILVLNQSTFPVGTIESFQTRLQDSYQKRKIEAKIHVAAMPEFISEGSAIQNFTRPDRIIIGADDDISIRKARLLMHPFNRVKDQIKIMSSRAAEYTKYAVNAILATRISLMNELANNAEKFGVDIEEVRQGIGSDTRVGFNYLYPGCGFGGTSFAADIETLVSMLESQGGKPEILKGVLSTNQSQKEVLFRKAWQYFDGDLKGKIIAIWGLAFKPNTATITRAPSLSVIDAFLAQGAILKVYDPMAMPNIQEHYEGQKALTMGEGLYDVLEDADALVILTEWKEFWNPDFTKIKDLLNTPVVFDGRNIFDPQMMQEQGVEYYAVGRGLSH